MKKLLYFAVVLFCVSSLSASCGIRKDVSISYDQIGTDAAYKQFRKANKINQAEILTNLVDQCERQYKNCNSVNDLHEVRENLHIIEFWINNADQKFIAITKRIRTLDHMIVDTLNEVDKNNRIVIEEKRTGYSGYGQELD